MPAINSQGTVVKVFTSDPAGSPPPAGVTIAQVTQIDGPTGEAPTIDVSHLGSTRREKLAGLRDDGELTLSGFWDSGDTGQDTLQSAASEDTFWFTLTTSEATPTVTTFKGHVRSFNFSYGVDNAIQFNSAITIDGAVTIA